jgi:striatin 1/3/4
MDEGVENGRPILGSSSGSTPGSFPPDTAMANYTIPGILHFVKHEWGRFEKEKAAWEVEKAELQAKIAFLQGERRGHENLMKDLVRRIKMLEYALKQERAKVYKMQFKKDMKFGDMSPPALAKEPDKSDVTMDIAAIVSQKEESRRLLREYLREVGFSDTVLEARVSRINAYRTLYSQNQIEALTTSTAMTNSITAVTSSQANPPSLHPSAPSLLPNGPIIANGTDTQVQGTGSALSVPGPHPLEPNRQTLDDDKRDNEPPVGGDLITENQALASFDFLATTGDSDSDEEEEEEEEERDDEEEGDPTVSVDDEFGFVNAIEPKGDHQEGWELTSEIARYHESKSRRVRTQSFQRPSRKAMDKLRNLSEAGSGIKGEGQRGGVSSPRSLAESVFPLPTQSEEKIGADRLGDLASLVEFNPESTVAGPPSHQSTKKWDVKYSMRGHFDVVTSLSFHPLEPLILTGSQDCSLKLWSLHSKKPSAHWIDLEPIHTFRGHRGGVLCVAMDVGGEVCFSGSADSNIRVWRVPSTDNDPYNNYDPEEHRGVLQGHTDAIWDLAVHPKTSLILSCAADGTVRLWNHTLTSPLVKLLDAEPGYRCPTSVDFLSTDPNLLVVSYSAAKTVIYDIETAKPVINLDSGTTYDGTPNTQINKVLAHPTLPIVVTGHEDKYIRFYDTVSGTELLLVRHSMYACMAIVDIVYS